LKKAVSEPALDTAFITSAAALFGTAEHVYALGLSPNQLAYAFKEKKKGARQGGCDCVYGDNWR
jgi:hypothetical protein